MAQLNLTQNSSMTSPSTIVFMYYLAFPCTCKITNHKFHTVSLSRTSFTAPCLLSSHNITTNFKQVWVHSWQLSSYNMSTEFSYLYYNMILWALQTIQNYILSWIRQHDYQSFYTTLWIMSYVYWICTAGLDYLVITSHSDAGVLRKHMESELHVISWNHKS